ncbi:carboxymuconolactone decarboxylase family protein [Aliiroseovarius sediminis]|uniref:carboxymuconolactone decarboxylase family protein n=1 Tax=Aliiroseovarius sediminis TaxID=2925839 RepID=UPI001F58CAD6|nr:carboxymuconolactone decarboxylase family protein [Aliiroseovarius sediminis]MCI2395976.1 carboxymuconolactone decarboxylase family protein [Aliiroseovarius sediminis]
MHSATYDKRIFSPSLLFRDLGFLISKAPALVGAVRNPDIGRVFTGKIMMVVTAVNGCTYCTWFHAQQAVTSGMSDTEIGDMFDLQFEASATEHELPALLYAQHYAETNRNPDPKMTERLDVFYGDRTASDIMLLIRVISFGNLLGNTFDAFPTRLKGQKAENSSALFELLFWLATFWLMLPAKWILQRRRSDGTKPDPTEETQ